MAVDTRVQMAAIIR